MLHKLQQYVLITNEKSTSIFQQPPGSTHTLTSVSVAKLKTSKIHGSKVMKSKPHLLTMPLDKLPPLPLPMYHTACFLQVKML
jgi:hypothetical protein